MTFTLNNPHGHVTTGGRKARVVCADRKTTSSATVLVLVNEANDIEALCYGSSTGKCWAVEEPDHEYQLVDVPAPKETIKIDRYVAVLENGTTSTHPNYKAAGDSSYRNTVIHIHGEIEVGDAVSLKLPVVC